MNSLETKQAIPSALADFVAKPLANAVRCGLPNRKKRH